MVMAGALTQVVKRAKIALLGATIPILNPVRVAEEFAMLDTMSGGRVVAGMLRGTPNEYVTYNINPAESRERFEEALELIRSAWTETEPFGWQGRYYEYRTISIWPRPVQKPHPPIYMSGSSPESGEFAARNRIGLGLAFTNVPLAKRSVAATTASRRRAGWTPTDEDIIYRVLFHVGETDEQALEDYSVGRQGGAARRLTMANKSLERRGRPAGYYGRDRDAQRAAPDADRPQGAHRARPRAARQSRTPWCGRSSTSTRARRRHSRPDHLHDLGDKTLRSIELFGTKVLPRIRDM